MTAAPDWLAAMQRRFGEVIRTPLDRSTGVLRAAVETYAPEAVEEAGDGPRADASARLAVYNRQYWFRLFTVVQTAFPVTARLLGCWTLNDYASRFFVAHVPHDWDIDRAPDGFDDFLAEALDDMPAREAVVDAARLDAAWHRIFRAPEVRPFVPSASDAARLLDARLLPSPAVALVRERYALMAARPSLLAEPSERAVPRPVPHPEARWWLLVRVTGGVGHHPLASREGELLSWLMRMPVRDALARVEADCDADERAQLPVQAQRWLAASVARGVWAGFAPG